MTVTDTYMLLIYRTGAEEPPPDKVDQALVGHRALQKEAASQDELHAVAKLGPTRGAKTVRVSGGAHEVTDGPYIETKEWLVGFYLLDCKTEQEALERAKVICPIADHAIEVRRVEWRWKG